MATVIEDAIESADISLATLSEAVDMVAKGGEVAVREEEGDTVAVRDGKNVDELLVDAQDLPPVAVVASFPEGKPCGVVVHGDEQAYPEMIPSDRSLDSLEGDASGDVVLFEHTTAIHVKAIEQLTSSGDFIQSTPIPLWLGNVLWSYALRITRVKEQKNALSLVSIGPHLGIDSTAKKGSLGVNAPRGATWPRVLTATLTMEGGMPKEATADDGETEIKDAVEEELTLELLPGKEGALNGSRQFTTEELVQLAGGPETTAFRCVARVTVEKAYFDLGKLVPLNQDAITDRVRGILDLILAGKRPPGWDWVITVGKHEPGEPSEYFVHKAAFASASEGFRAAVSTGHSFKEHILHVTGENRVIMPGLTAEDMKTVIPLVYALHAPLPRWQRVSAFGRTLCILFRPNLVLGAVFPQWERALVREGLAVDATSTLPACAELVRLVNVVWSCPYGSLPVAKRVLVGRLADVIHLSGVEESRFIVERMLPALDDDLREKSAHLQPILDSVVRHLIAVRSVRKTDVSKVTAAPKEETKSIGWE